MGIPAGVLVDMLFAFMLCVCFDDHLVCCGLHSLVGEYGITEDVVKRMAPTLTSLLFLEVGAAP